MSRHTMNAKCPKCNALEIPDDFPTANQGLTTTKYECGSEYYDDHEVYPCGYKPMVLYPINSKDPKIKELLKRLRRL